MNRFYNIPNKTKERIYKNAGEYNNLPAFAVEKDWWVVQTLAILFEMEIGAHLVFKGGTSLSKAWNIIERFSEDIDLAIDRMFFGFEGELGKNQRTKLRKKANKYISETLYPALIKAYKDRGLNGLKIELDEIKSSDQDPVIINIYYPNIIESPGYIQPRVQVEIGCRSLKEPYKRKLVSSIIDSSFPDTDFNLKPVEIPTVLPERTFLEKIFLLHEEFNRPNEKVRVGRLSRHLYDIYQISKTEYKVNAFLDKDLYETIVKHRYNFTRMGGVNYNFHQPQTIAFLPSKDVISLWEADYITMREQMIHSKAPDFHDLMKALSALQKEINNIDWKMNYEFPAINK